jgi:hypothetical protein
VKSFLFQETFTSIASLSNVWRACLQFILRIALLKKFYTKQIGYRIQTELMHIIGTMQDMKLVELTGTKEEGNI